MIFNLAVANNFANSNSFGAASRWERNLCIKAQRDLDLEQLLACSDKRSTPAKIRDQAE